MTKEEYILSQLGGFASMGTKAPHIAAAAVPDSGDANQGLFLTALDYLNRPYNTVMGGVVGGMQGDALGGMMKGVKGEDDYSVLDVATELGFNPQSNWTRGISLAADIVNPLDPMNYVGGGFTKVGKVAKGLKGGTVGVDAAKVASRAVAAQEGLWSPITVFGRAAMPKSMSAVAGKAVDAVAGSVDRWRKYNSVAKHFGGVRKFEADHPGVSEVMRGMKHTKNMSEDEFSDSMKKINAHLVKGGMPPAEADDAIREATSLLETPEAYRKKVEFELGEINAGKWKAPVDPLKTDGEAAFAETAGMEHLKANLDRMEAVQRHMDTLTDPMDIAKAKDELHELKTATSVFDGADAPIPETMIAREKQLLGELKNLEKNPGNFSPGAHKVADMYIPTLNKIDRGYDEIGKQYDPDFKSPVKNYMKHMFPAQESRFMRKSAEGFTASDGKKLKFEDESKGQLFAFQKREHDMNIAESIEKYKNGDTPFYFESNSTRIVDAMHRDYSRYKFGHDAHKWVYDQGLTKNAEQFAAMTAKERKGYVPFDFHLYGVDPKKNPYQNIFISRELNDVIQTATGVMNISTSKEGWGGLLQVAHNFTTWWKGMTLAPFPAFHARNLADELVKNHMGGLSPVLDMAKVMTGDSTYAAAGGFMRHLNPTGWVNKTIPNADESLNKFFADVNARFPEAEFTPKKLAEWMQREDLIGQRSIRDLDLGANMDDPLLGSAMKGRKLKDVVLGKVESGIKKTVGMPDDNVIVKKGFELGQKVTDFTRTATFIHAIKEVIGSNPMLQAKSFDDALMRATAKTRELHLDYNDFTEFEKKYMKLIMPFYAFTSKNLPLQIKTAVTDYGKLAWVNRGYQAAWDGVPEEELRHEDLPDYLQKELGVPMNKVQVNGVDTWNVWTPRGWLSVLEIDEFADMIRGVGDGNPGEAMRNIFMRLNPLLKEPMEQALNADAFTRKQIEKGQVEEVFGQPVPERVAHLLANIRVINEMDKLNPGGIFTELGKWRGHWEEKRPHRREEPTSLGRAFRFMTGVNRANVETATELERKVRDDSRAAQDLKTKAMMSKRFGQTLESEQYMNAAKEKQESASVSLSRLNEVRRAAAVKVAGRDM